MIRWRYAHPQRLLRGAQKALCVVILLCLATTVSGQTDFQEVDPGKLLENPKNYWSLGIVFKDRLMDAQAGRRTEIGSKEYIPFRTLEVGTCYAEARLAPELSSAQLDREYLFRGTVLNRQASFFSRQDTFFVVVQNIEPALEETTVSSSDLLPSGTGRADSLESKRLLSTVQQDLFAYAEQKGLSINDLFSDITYRAQVMDIINSAIVQQQNEQNTTALALLGELIYNVYAKDYARAPKMEAASRKSSRIDLKAGIGSRGISTTPDPKKNTDEEQPPEKPAKPKLKLRDGMNNVEQPVSW